MQSSTVVGPLQVGAARIDITPEGPASLLGQMDIRVSDGVNSPLSAEAVALEVVDSSGAGDHAVLIAIDAVGIPDEIFVELRDALRGQVPGLDVEKIILNATHTHTAPAVIQDEEHPAEAMVPSVYRAFLVDRLAQVTKQAWENRAPGNVGWGLGHAVVGLNRRAVYADGRSVMYGKTKTDDFRGLEGYEDHVLETLCFWNEAHELIATAVNVACPSQEVESLRRVDADFWHQVRNQLRAEHGDGLVVLGWAAAAGDQSPHLMLRKDAEERMRKLRGLNRLEEVARRVVQGWQEAYEGARQEQHREIELGHTSWTADLAVRQVTEQEVADAREFHDSVEASDDRDRLLPRLAWLRRVIERYETQTPETTFPTRVHALRVGDVAITTNQFELFTDFGIQLKERSPALQTFVIQLAGNGTYLPTERAVRGGGYSAVIASNEVGPEGGQQLVEETLTAVNGFWAK